jgi:hypothetical protein
MFGSQAKHALELSELTLNCPIKSAHRTTLVHLRMSKSRAAAAAAATSIIRRAERLPVRRRRSRALPHGA